VETDRRDDVSKFDEFRNGEVIDCFEDIKRICKVEIISCSANVGSIAVVSSSHPLNQLYLLKFLLRNNLLLLL